MSDDAKKEADSAEGGAGKSKKKLIIIIAGVVILLAAAGIPVLMMGGSEEPVEGEENAAEEEHVESHDKHYVTVPLDTFVVNLSANSSFLKVAIILEYDPEILSGGVVGEGGGEGHGGGGAGGGDKDAGLPGKIGEREPMIRDTILRILSSKKAEDILTVEGKEHLKEELIEGINEAIGLEEGPIVNIYFAEFMVQ